jgi:cellulose synthase/poly-beta-1,6-N-acetylglucosamine synthase-like glycosyltransferase
MLFLGYLLSIFLGLAYIALIVKYLYHWKSISELPANDNDSPTTFLSILVAARNEEVHIATCLESLLRLDYPADKFEIIVIDDYSTDRTAAITKEYQVFFPQLRLISLSKEGIREEQSFPKRKAIEVGLRSASGEYILLTDADCEVPVSWARLISGIFLRETCVFVGGPVLISSDKGGILHHFQLLDMLGMMIITGAGYHSGTQLFANGANMSFSKKAFIDSGGFAHFPPRASGDDMFLLHQLHTYKPGGIRFIKSLAGTVKTRPMDTIRALLQQRIRWASKNRTYRDGNLNSAIILIFLLSALIVLLGILSMIQFSIFFPFFVILYLLKFSGDYMLQREATSFFKEDSLMKHFFQSQNLHTLYIFIVGIAGNLLPAYRWKGRILK